MRSTELIHEIISKSGCNDNRQIMNLLKELRKQTVFEAVKEIVKLPINELRLSDLPGKLYRRTYSQHNSK